VELDCLVLHDKPKGEIRAG